MPPSVTLRSGVIAVKERLLEERASIRRQHDAGSPGIQICTRLTEMFDRAVLDLYNQAVADLSPHNPGRT